MQPQNWKSDRDKPPASHAEPTVSVICPIRNEEDYIDTCLRALLEQTYDQADMEILVVDGMSDDSTREIVQSYARSHPNLRLLDNPRRIVPCALNLGIGAARGRYILRMDGHARPARDYVANCVQVLANREILCIGGPIISVNETETGKAIAAAMSSPFGVGNSRFRTSDNQECFVDTLAFPAFKREVFTKYGLFDEDMVRCQDDEFNFRLRKGGNKILLTPKIRSWYYPRAGFGKLWRQYFGYGFWKVRVLQKHFWLMQPRHFAPACFVTTLMATLVLGLFMPLFAALFAGLSVVYLSAASLAAIRARRNNSGAPAAKILRSFIILHFSYGSGFLWGLLRFAPRWLRRRPSEHGFLESEAVGQSVEFNQAKSS